MRGRRWNSCVISFYQTTRCPSISLTGNKKIFVVGITLISKLGDYRHIIGAHFFEVRHAF